ncbi:unnamed protein product [Triticum turgidum subsp. durum]|uniref:Uncharacterized protein n=1 Tax=Triticum turgidum subsp. durum TaxID=4567 RepID=A0A9R0U042_TRITD|nr:unnamed protein product [Triticum turgidum subsp. durum]
MALHCYTPLLKPQLAQVSVNPSINTIQIPESVLRPSAKALTGPCLGQPFSKSMQIAGLPRINMLLA